MVKQPKNLTLDKEVLEKIDKESKEQKRSLSFIVNEILLEYYKKRSKK